jgi:CheY-like chemotaxis protein
VAHVGEKFALGAAGGLRGIACFGGRLTRQLDQFEKHLKDAAQSQAAKTIENSGLRQKFDGLRPERVATEMQQVDGKLQEAQQWARQFDKDYREQAATVTRHEFPPAQPVVMLVDDDEVYREMLGIMLEEVGLRLVQSNTGEAGLAEMRKRRPDIVLLDYEMPGLGGEGTLRQMKADPELQNIPVIMLTGVGTREVMMATKQAGAANFIVKPSNRPTILAKITSLLLKTNHLNPGDSPPAAAG